MKLKTQILITFLMISFCANAQNEFDLKDLNENEIPSQLKVKPSVFLKFAKEQWMKFIEKDEFEQF